MKKKLIAQFSAATGIPIAQITLSVVAGSVLLQFTVVVLAANAATSQSSITTALSTPSLTQSALAPALPTGSLVTLAAVVTSAPYSGATYTAGKAKKLKKKCKNKKNWCSSVTLTNGKCNSYDGRAARKVRSKFCRASCKERCRSFLQSAQGQLAGR